ncbi:hypothetical protein KFE25_011943 [Diacronema lutheri]|uniref:Ankyrin repeat protein n=1 Tax=Diacronema lutheri TaxID=2081491 RepID=A0A8J6C162_DIALT|nr:hypothetical protein KFE25_011943 [Diacronema lutheri]
MRARGRDLVDACHAGRVDAVLSLIAHGADADEGGDIWHDSTALMVASARGHVACVRALLDARAAVDRATTAGTTALMYASRGGHADCVHTLLCAGAAVDRAKEGGWTALALGSRAGRVGCVRALLRARAAVNRARGGSGATALMYACQGGHTDCARALLGAGALADRAKANGATALMVASVEGRVNCVRALLRARAAVDMAMAGGVTALAAASEYGHVDCAAALLRARADVNGASGSGHTPLVRARRHLRVLQLLCAYGARREELLSPAHPMVRDVPAECLAWLTETRRWSTALHHVEHLPTRRVRALLVAGADVSVTDGGAGDAPTPLALALALLARSARAHAGAQLVVDAARAWSPATHALFPACARARAVQLLLVGVLIARGSALPYLAPSAHALLDVWLRHVMAHAVSRGECGPEPVCMSDSQSDSE